MQQQREKFTEGRENNGHDQSGGSDPYAHSRPIVAGKNSVITGIGPLSTDECSSNSFYEKLCKLNEPSGLSLVFNFRETSLDLYLFYKEVIKRGGFHQVTKDGKWSEVASVIALKSSRKMLPLQLQKLYASLLHQYEQIYYYRTPAAQGLQAVVISTDVSLCSGDSSSCSTGKRKRCDSSSDLPIVHFVNDGGVLEKGHCDKNGCQLSPGTTMEEQDSPVQASPRNRETKKDRKAPVRLRTAYQMFLKLECERLKKIHGESFFGQNLRKMATDTWRDLPGKDRQPYVEASRKDRERYMREMDAYQKKQRNKLVKQSQNTTNGSSPAVISFATSSKLDPDDEEYHVTYQPDDGEFFIPDESEIESTVQLMKNAKPNDPLFQINWDDPT